ncbi:MAG: hypothetical protein K6F37_09705, partial [Lachnospiraceae bacterium]|nr:hypothetical protein [Lachnospiraceae bacterium]
MKVNYDELMSVNAASMVQQTTQLPPMQPQTGDNEDGMKIGGGMDSYIPSMASYNDVIPSGIYGSDG